MKKLITALSLILSVSFAPAFSQTIGGIGASLFIDTTGGYTMPRVQSLIQNTPAYDSLKATDYIIKVDDADCKNKTIEEVVGMIRGQVGTTVKITVADTKGGKRPRVYNLSRVGMQLAPPKDPAAAFNEICENEAKQIRKKHLTVLKSVTSDCGNYFFNFDAETEPCHISIITLEEKGIGAFSPGFYTTVKVSEGANETELTKGTPKETANSYVARMEGTITFKRPTVATIAVTIHDDIKKCKGMYVLVYSDKPW